MPPNDSRDVHNDGQITIVPGVSIGPIRLGSLDDAFQGPRDARGHLIVPAGLSALVSRQGVLDIWIDNLRTLWAPVFIKGKLLPRNSSYHELLNVLGPCEEVLRNEQGTTFNCACDLSFRMVLTKANGALTIWVKRRPLP